MEIILIIYFFVIGAIFGSFLNMLVYRVNKGQNLLGRSYCDITKKPLKTVDLIPIFSYMVFKGKCRDCHKKISPLYPIVEFLMGLVSVFVFLKINNSIPVSDQNLFQIIGLWFIFFSVCFVFIYFAYYDLLYWEVDFRSIIISLIFFVLINVLNIVIPLPFLPSLQDSLAGGVLLAGLIFSVFKLSKGGGMGEGDIYLFGLTGLLLGVMGGLMALVVTSISGSLVGLILAGIKKKSIHGMKIQLAPYIAFGSIIIFFFKDILLKFILGF